MRYRAAFRIVLLALSLCGCDQKALIQKFVLPEHDKAARIYFEDVRTGNFGPVLAAVDPVYRDQITVDLCKNMRTLFGTRPVKTITVVGARITAQKLVGKPGAKLNSLTYEYDMGDRFVIANAVLQKAGDKIQIEGISVQALAQSIEKVNAFTFSGKSAIFFAFLALAIATPVFIIVTAIVCWRTAIPRRKWLWRVFVLFGITQFTLNWTTGHLQFLPLQINLLGAGFTQQFYGPVILQVGIPLGAVLFWIRRRKWLEQPSDSAQHFS